MPIKTIQPFVSDFNAFAGEGFYGNVVQGLVIKQLEDVVFIFGIAIDGTLIFRKRNYPDVSTWEDPKIIIHSNNWHKIYSKPDLGELIGVATAKKDGLMPMEQFFDRDVNPIEDYNTFTWNGIRKTTKSTSNSPFESGDGQNAVIFIGTMMFKNRVSSNLFGAIY